MTLSKTTHTGTLTSARASGALTERDSIVSGTITTSTNTVLTFSTHHKAVMAQLLAAPIGAPLTFEGVLIPTKPTYDHVFADCGQPRFANADSEAFLMVTAIIDQAS